MTEYLVLVGVNYPPLKRAEPGDIVDDLDPQTIPVLLAQGVIEPVKEDRDVGQPLS